jgi:FKBP-type peptidyl-prolyl cis-trans isomerase SlyD
MVGDCLCIKSCEEDFGPPGPFSGPGGLFFPFPGGGRNEEETMRAEKRRVGLRETLAGIVITLFTFASAPAGEKEAAMTVTNGNRVSIEYTLTLPDKTQVDTNIGKEPLTYTQGGQEILPDLQKALLGLKEGETKSVTLSPEEGYGPVDPNALQEVNKDLIPAEALKVGTPLVTKDSSGRPHRLRVQEVKEETVVLDFNHPLAGETLIFDVKVLKIEDAP